MKKCSNCKRILSVNNFCKDRSRKDGRNYICKECACEITIRDKKQLLKNSKIYYKKNKKRLLKRMKSRYYKYVKERQKRWRKNNPDKIKGFILYSKYKIRLDDFNKLFKKQNGVCAICGKKELEIDPQTKKIRSLAVDHDHKSNKIRGLLCGKCNKGIGHFQDSIEVLQSAIKYLKRNKNNVSS